MWRCPGEEFDTGSDDENPNFHRVPRQISEDNPSVEPQLQSSQSSEPQLPPPRRRITSQQFERNVRARRSMSSVAPVRSNDAALAFSASSLEPAYVSKKQWRKVRVEVSYPVTAEMFENPEERLACDCVIQGSCSCRSEHYEVYLLMNVHSFEQLKAKEMDQWISHVVISVCQRAGIPKEQIMTMRWVHTWKVAEDTGETKAKARLVVKGFTDPDLTEISAESPTLNCVSRFSLEKGRCENSLLVW